MTEKELFSALIGRDENGEPKALIDISFNVYKKSIKTFVPQRKIELSDVIMDLQICGDVVFVRLKFKNTNDINLRLITDAYRLYEKLAAEVDDDSPDIPCFSLTSTPFNSEYTGYCLIANNPLWALAGSSAITLPDTFVMVFPNESVNTGYSTRLGQKEIEEEVEREILEEERMKEKEAEAEEARAELQGKRNAAIYR